jgi:hypothetical protein
MQIRIMRSTVVKPNGEGPRAVDAGDVVDVDHAQARQLIEMRKAVAFLPAPVAAPAVTPEAALIPVETRKRTRNARPK